MSRRQQHERLTSKLDSVLSGVATVDALRSARELVLVLERRLEVETKPMDLFTLPLDIPQWDDLYAELVIRALQHTGAVTQAADLIGIGRSTLYNQLRKGLFHEAAAHDPRIARLLDSLDLPVVDAEHRAKRRVDGVRTRGPRPAGQTLTAKDRRAAKPS
jgi:hypothetical protein